jgi:hypothetical protein
VLLSDSDQAQAFQDEIAANRAASDRQFAIDRCNTVFTEAAKVVGPPTTANADTYDVNNVSLRLVCREGAEQNSPTFCETAFGPSAYGTYATNTAAGTDGNSYTAQAACLYGQTASRNGAQCPDGEVPDGNSATGCSPGSSQTSTATEEAPTCESNGGSFGWIMCPVIRMLDAMVSATMGLITDQLNYKRLNDNLGPVKQAWDKFVPIANIAFVIVFLIIIYSTAIGGGTGGKPGA